MKRFNLLAGIFALFAIAKVSYAQTNPTAVSLPFALNSQTSSVLPNGVAVHRFSSIQTSRSLTPASGGDLSNQGSSAAGTAGGWYHLSADGIGLLASGTNPAGAVIVAINTTSLSNIAVSWICKTIKNQTSRDNSIALQYRLGTSGNFTDVGNLTTYSSAGNTDGHTSSVFTETLPAAANNQSVVQVRWIYWESVGTSGSRDKMSVDNISISASTSSACNTPAGLMASGTTSSGAVLNWNTVAGASSYEYALSTSSTAPGSGTNSSVTSYSATGLSASTLYYFHVRTVCSGIFSDWTSRSFTTLSGGGESNDFVVMTYNLLNYPGSTGSSREPSYRIIVDSVKPDIVVVQELSSSSGNGNFLSNVMNYSSSTYSAAAFIDGPDSDNGLYYKSSKFQFISNTAIATSLRDINQFKLKHSASGDTLIIFSAHLKAGNDSGDDTQRASEVDSLRKITDAFAAGKYFMVCGDFNIYGSSESAYSKLISNGNNVNGKFYDILSMSGTWNNSSYAIHHTQSPRTTAFGGGATGGLDDRFDMFLFSNAIIQAGGFDIVSNSYKSFGNDGNHYNMALNTSPYSIYSSTICSAIHDASDHLPVIVKLSNTGARSAVVNGFNKVPGVQNMVSVYPNPAQSLVYVKINSTAHIPAQFYLYDVSGKALMQLPLSNGGNETLSLNVADLAPGTYFYKIELEGNKTETGKLLILKH